MLFEFWYFLLHINIAKCLLNNWSKSQWDFVTTLCNPPEKGLNYFSKFRTWPDMSSLQANFHKSRGYLIMPTISFIKRRQVLDRKIQSELYPWYIMVVYYSPSSLWNCGQITWNFSPSDCHNNWQSRDDIGHVQFAWCCATFMVFSVEYSQVFVLIFFCFRHYPSIYIYIYGQI